MRGYVWTLSWSDAFAVEIILSSKYFPIQLIASCTKQNKLSFCNSECKELRTIIKNPAHTRKNNEHCKDFRKAQNGVDAMK